MNTQPEALRLVDILEHKIPSIKCLEVAAAELHRLHDYKSSYEIWLEKTNWVQDSSQWHELGKHRADVLKDRIDRLHEVNQELVEALEQITKVEYQSPVTMYQAMEDIAKAALAKARGTE